jgi:hypothetical protein
VPRASPNGERFEVHCSGIIARSLKQIQRRAKREGRGQQVLEAIRRIRRRLTNDPMAFGEPLYRLPAMRLQVRHVAVGPLLVYFGVHEDRPVVFIKAVNLLPEQDS